MNLTEALKFARGAVKKTAFSPDLEYFQIKDGRVVGFNGFMALAAPVDLDLTAFPHATMFAKAVEACRDQTSLSLDKNGCLAVVSKGFRAFVPCVEEVTFPMTPEGDEFPVPSGFVEALRVVAPIISDDASRLWSMGALVADGMFTVTNNIVFVQHWTGHRLPRINLPKYVISEVIRNKRSPSSMRTDGNSVTFLYEDGAWIRSQLLVDDWPLDVVTKIMGVEHSAEALPPDFRDAVSRIEPFVGKSDPVYFYDGELRTSQAEGDGVVVACPGLKAGPCFNMAQLKALADIAHQIDFSIYPSPCIFYGDSLRGAVAGRRR